MFAFPLTQVRCHFEQYGEVVDAVLIKNKQTGEPRGEPLTTPAAFRTATILTFADFAHRYHFTRVWFCRVQRRERGHARSVV